MGSSLGSSCLTFLNCFNHFPWRINFLLQDNIGVGPASEPAAPGMGNDCLFWRVMFCFEVDMSSEVYRVINKLDIDKRLKIDADIRILASKLDASVGSV